MNKYFSVFKKPLLQGAFKYPCGGQTLEEERQIAQDLARMPGNQFGQYQYSRPVGQAPLELRRRYSLTFGQMAQRLRWRAVDELIEAPFDYVNVTGPHRSFVSLPCKLPARIEDLGLSVDSVLSLGLEGVQSFKFQDLLKSRLFELDISTGQPQLLCYEAVWSMRPSEAIPLVLPESLRAAGNPNEGALS